MPQHGKHAGWYQNLDINPIEKGEELPSCPTITHSMASMILLADSLEQPGEIEVKSKEDAASISSMKEQNKSTADLF